MPWRVLPVCQPGMEVYRNTMGSIQPGCRDRAQGEKTRGRKMNRTQEEKVTRQRNHTECGWEMGLPPLDLQVEKPSRLLAIGQRLWGTLQPADLSHQPHGHYSIILLCFLNSAYQCLTVPCFLSFPLQKKMAKEQRFGVLSLYPHTQ